MGLGWRVGTGGVGWGGMGGREGRYQREAGVRFRGGGRGGGGAGQEWGEEGERTAPLSRSSATPKLGAIFNYLSVGGKHWN